MKSFKLLTMAAVAGFAVLGTASAQTYVYITGSTAFRAQTVRAIARSLTNVAVATNATSFTIPGAGNGYAYENTSSSSAVDPTSAKAVSFKGNLGGSGAAVVIKCSWSGSTGGLQAVAYSASNTPSTFPVKFLDNNVTYANGNGAGNTYTDPTANAAANESVPADATIADSKQVSTVFNGTYLGKSYSTLIEQGGAALGVQAFQWIISNYASLSAPTKARVDLLTNMTPLLAQAQWTGFGTLPLSAYTGVASDASITIHATGRDFDSGTRTQAFAESGIGSTNISIQQYDAGAAVEPSLYPAQVLNGISFEEGQSGENGGGTLVSNTKMGKPGLTQVYVSYAGTSDAAKMVSPGGGRTLSYNGVPYSVAAVQNGQYSFWGYVRMYYRSSLTNPGNATKLAAVNSIGDYIRSTYAITLTGLNVSRDNDGGVITPN
jgi:hypothetical protein